VAARVDAVQIKNIFGHFCGEFFGKKFIFKHSFGGIFVAFFIIF
jgi:hypothetical protein